MKKKGFTLIELVASLSILGIIFSFGSGSYKVYKSTYSDIKINHSLYEIEDTLSYGEIYCKSNKIDGIFYIEEKKNKLIVGLKDRLGNSINKVNISDSLSLYMNMDSSKIKTLNINSNGKIQSGSIKFKAINGKKYELTVRVGANLITIRELK